MPRRSATRCSRLAVSSISDRRLGSPIAEHGNGPIGQFKQFPRAGVPEDVLVEAGSRTTARSVYLPIARELLPDALAVFDFAEPGFVTGSRETTNVPSQALYMLNSPFIASAAQKFAERVIAAYPASTQRRRPARAVRLRARVLPLPERSRATGGLRLLREVSERSGNARSRPARVDFLLPRALRERRVPLSQLTAFPRFPHDYSFLRSSLAVFSRREMLKTALQRLRLPCLRGPRRTRCRAVRRVTRRAARAEAAALSRHGQSASSSSA